MTQTERRFALGLLTLGMLGLTACGKSPVAFDQEIQNTDLASKPPELESIFEVNESIKIQETDAAPLDLVWVIDNSGSMADKAANVRANFQKFIDKISSRADLKLALVSKKGTTGTAVSLPTSTKGSDRFLQINQQVESFDGLLILEDLLCAGASTPACRSVEKANSSVTAGNLPLLRPFLRADAKKVFIFATDDNALPGTPDFLEVFREVFGAGHESTVYGFIGLGKSASPCQYNTGAAYRSLVTATEGKAYNICDKDWSGSFDQLAKAVIELVDPVVKLRHESAKVRLLDVRADGKDLDSSQYSLISSGVKIAASALGKDKNNKAVKIRYKLK